MPAALFFMKNIHYVFKNKKASSMDDLLCFLLNTRNYYRSTFSYACHIHIYSKQ